MASSFKKAKVKFVLLIDIDMLLMVEKVLKEEYVILFIDMQKLIKKYMKDYDKNKESSYLQYWDVKNLYGWAMPQNLTVNNFEWIEDTSQFNKNFIKNYNEESDEGYFLVVDVQYLEKLHKLHND